MLRGIDISHWNNRKDVEKFIANNATDFIIRKATEGKTYVDPTITTPYPIPTMGYYHYARPDNNNPEEESIHFWETVKALATESTMFFLDWEGVSLNFTFDWALKFKRNFEKISNRKLFMYGSLSTYNKYKDNNVLWWVAHHNTNCSDGCLHTGTNTVLTQWSSSGIDKNVFLGTFTNWKDLASPIVSEDSPTIEVLCRFESKGYTYEVRRYKL